MAAELAYLQENSLTDYIQLEKEAKDTTDYFPTLSNKIKQTEIVLKTNKELMTATVMFARTRPIYEKYEETKYIGEAFALKWSDIDFHNHTITINKQAAKAYKRDENKRRNP